MKRLSAKNYADVLWQTWQKTPVTEHGSLIAAFLELLQGDRALKLAPRILEQVQVLEDTAAGVKRVRVEAAAALDEVSLTKQLKTLLGPVVVDLSVNPTLIAGLRVRVGDELIDSSVATQLQHLQHHLSTSQ